MAAGGNFKETKDAISSALVETTRVAGQISNEDLAFHRSSNPSVIPILEQQNTRLLRLTHKLTKAATWGTEVSAPYIANVDSVDDNWKNIVDVFDNLLEKADACLDEFTGSIKRLSPGQEDQIKKTAPVHGKRRIAKVYRNQDMQKPQLLFEDRPKNDEQTPFKPLLRSKPHAMVSLEDSLGEIDSDDGSMQYDSQFYLFLRDVPPHLKDLINIHLSYKHPYEVEIKAARYPPSTFVKSDPIQFLSFEDTKATLVDTPEAVATMLAELKQAQEIAVDLEHHDEHSYIGLVSLMQISTRKKDWVVDTLKPWRRDLQVLNEVFTDPNTLKVLHGAFMDMVWLQRDLGLYVVNLFDTFHASRALGYPQKSLAYLLKRFVDVDAAKQYQTADWRLRPLPEEMFDYARSDTHYLLYIYDNMRNELIDKSSLFGVGENLVETVMRKSKEVALQRYERPFYDFQRGSGSTGWYNMLYRTPALFNREQFAVFRAVHQWRDYIARQEDENVQSVMPKHVLYNIARETPMDMPSLLGCSHPMSKLFQKRKADLLEVIQRAKVQGAFGPDMKELMQEIDPLLGQTTNANGAAGPLLLNEAKAGPQLINPVKQNGTTLPLRSNKSRFWGPSMSNAVLTDFAFKNQGHSLALPLPHLTAEVFEDISISSHSRGEELQSNLGALPGHQYVTDRPSKRNDVFILGDDGGSRKRKATMYPEETGPLLLRGDDVTSTREKTEILLNRDSESERKREKAELKAKKQRLKGTKKEEANRGVAQDDETIEAFDYANAPSILHPKQSRVDRTAAASKGVDPYAKSMDAPKGMRKSMKEAAGKSHTFKA